jgi:hypothetical protein
MTKIKVLTPKSQLIVGMALIYPAYRYRFLLKHVSAHARSACQPPEANGATSRAARPALKPAIEVMRTIN